MTLEALKKIYEDNKSDEAFIGAAIVYAVVSIGCAHCICWMFGISHWWMALLPLTMTMVVVAFEPEGFNTAKSKLGLAAAMGVGQSAAFLLVYILITVVVPAAMCVALIAAAAWVGMKLSSRSK